MHTSPIFGNAARVDIAGMLIDDITMAAALDRIEVMIARREPTYVVTPNVDHVVRYHGDGAFRQVYEQAPLVLADGMPLLWAARFLGSPLPEKVSGSDLFPLFCERAARRGYRLFFMGGRPGAAQRSAEILHERHPGLNVVRVHCPPLGFERDKVENQRTIQMICDSEADLLFVGLGTPKQELWIHRHHRECAVPVSIGIGASFDFTAGYVQRAPRVLQATGLEWLWRLVLEPRRMYRRYLVDDPEFFSMVWRQRRRTGRRGLAGQMVACATVDQASAADRVSSGGL